MTDNKETPKAPESGLNEIWGDMMRCFNWIREAFFIDRDTWKTKRQLVLDALGSAWKSKTVADASDNKRS